jgi:4-oxalocrotonate tautomerase
MPIIQIQVSAKPDPALSRRIAEEVGSQTRDILRKDPTVTAVTVQSIDPEHWFAGGSSLAEQGLSSYWLDIKVVDGTNTKTELEAYVSAIFERMGQILGPLHTESYALVHEVPAAAYGYGGKTQEYRFIAGRIGAKG